MKERPGSELGKRRGPREELDGWAAGLLAAGFSIFFLVVYGGASAASALIPWRLRVALPIEGEIPFVPWAAALYLSVLPVLCLAPRFLRRRRELFPFAATLAAETAAAAFFFLAFPVSSSFPPRQAEGPAAPLFDLANLLNLERNEVPSLHVAFAVTAALAYGRGRSRAGRFALAVWALGTSVSAVLLHEHHLLDVFAGAGLALVCHRRVGAWAHRREVLEAFEVELLCWRNFLLFGRRHRRYGLIALALIRASLPQWRRRRILRTGFCFLQEVDDLLDGDRPCSREPLEEVDEVLRALESGDFGDSPLHRLGSAFSADLRETAGREGLDRAVRLIRVLQRDRRRVLEHRLLGRQELRRHLRETFELSVDLMLAAGGAELRARDVPELIEVLGWCSTVRDLAEDLEAGLVNVPAEVVREARENGLKGLGFPDLVTHPTVIAWLEEERRRARELLDEADRKLREQGSRRGRRVLQLFSRSIRGYAQRRFPSPFPPMPAVRPRR